MSYHNMNVGVVYCWDPDDTFCDYADVIVVGNEDIQAVQKDVLRAVVEDFFESLHNVVPVYYEDALREFLDSKGYIVFPISKIANGYPKQGLMSGLGV